MLRTTTIALGVATIASGSLAAPIPREGSGPRRDALNALETTPLPRDACDGVDAWVGSGALPARDFKDAVTIIVTTDVAEPDSIRYTRQLWEMMGRHEGLGVLAIHPTEGWDRFSLLHDAGTIKVAGARDADGQVREWLMADENADVFIFDKAGQLRYADVEPIAVERAVKELLAESADDASGEAARRAKMIAAGEDPYGPTRGAKVALPAPEDMTPAMLAGHVYAKADWPEHNTDFGANDLQGQPLPSISHVTWISEDERFTDTANKVLVLDFWATWCGPCIRAMPKLQALQKAYPHDLLVMGVGGQGEEEAKVRSWVREKGEHYANVYDGSRRIISKFAPKGIPFVVVASTDGTVRWTGNPHDPGFVDAVHKVMAVDPLVRARKGDIRLTEADFAYIPEAGSGSLDWPEACPSNRRYSGEDMHAKRLDDPFAGLEWLDGQGAPDTAGKVVIVDFWATWCGPCKKFSPRLDALVRKHAGDVVAVAVSGQGEEIGTVRDYIAKHPAAYRHAYAEDQELYEKIGVTGIPHVVVMSSDGVVRWHGFPNAVDFEAVVEQVIEANRELNRITMATP